jgi:hypothetical protein
MLIIEADENQFLKVANRMDGGGMMGMYTHTSRPHEGLGRYGPGVNAELSGPYDGAARRLIEWMRSRGMLMELSVDNYTSRVGPHEEPPTIQMFTATFVIRDGIEAEVLRERLRGMQAYRF